MFASLAVAALLTACGTPSTTQNLGRENDESHLRVAQAAAASGDLQLAESVYANASTAAPSDTTVQLGYADTLLRLNQISQARDVLVSHLQTVREPQRLRGPLGAIDVLQGNATQAVKELDSAIAGDPGSMRWVVDKAIALDMLGQHSAAQVLYRKALADQPDDIITINDFALSLALSGQKSEALRIAAPLDEHTDLPHRVAVTYDVLRAVGGGDVSGGRDSLDPSDHDKVLRLAKAMEDAGH
ncbi:MAG TPA: tetratricopeptide repeat protein [Acetobacteraceae bacterium]|nr:tetratricopeptide repeat protein [Acetobacteraceae bacterium]